jgi:hypothetical protein
MRFPATLFNPSLVDMLLKCGINEISKDETRK